jgi:endonuclease-3
VGRRCWECDLGKEGLCPSAVPEKASPRKMVKREVKVEMKVEDGEAEIVEAVEVKKEEDEVGVKVEAQSEQLGVVELQATAGSHVDIEDAMSNGG